MIAESSPESRFVTNICSSARPSSSSAEAPSSGKTAQPIEASISTTPPSTVYGRRSACRRRPTERAHLLLGGGLEREDDELVAADPRHGVARADDGLEPPRDRLQDLVAGVVAADVVDLLEAVEVDHEERERRDRAARSLQRLLESVVEQRPVGEARERVAERERLGHAGPAGEAQCRTTAVNVDARSATARPVPLDQRTAAAPASTAAAVATAAITLA